MQAIIASDELNRLADDGCPHGDDDLWLDHLAAEHHDGHTAAANQLLTELCQHRDAEVLEDLPPKLYNRICEIHPDNAR